MYKQIAGVVSFNSYLDPDIMPLSSSLFLFHSQAGTGQKGRAFNY